MKTLSENCIPIILIKNEEKYIEKVVSSALKLSGVVIVGDTGSTDKTPDIVQSFERVVYVPMGEMTPSLLGLARNVLFGYARDMSAEFVFIVDGDELYLPDQMEFLGKQSMPEGKKIGFTTLLDLDEEGEEVWALNNRFNRLAVHSPNWRYVGEYPFESPIGWTDDPSCYHYFPIFNNGIEHGYHLHRLNRSPVDYQVYMRKEKQYKFSLQDKEIPRTHRVSL